MGVGKTSAAITEMNSNHNTRYLFVTPFLSEVDRVLEACNERHFYAPENYGEGKLASLEYHISQGHCVASTHALFTQYTERTGRLIEEMGYTLIMDEVMCVMENLKVKPKDIEHMLRSGLAKVGEDGERFIWLDENYEGRFSDIMAKAVSGRVTIFNDIALFWTFPSGIFKHFRDIIVLTYMFDAQVQRYYYQLHNFDVKYIGVVQDSSCAYRFTDFVPRYSNMSNVPGLIDICYASNGDRRSLNKIGADRNALSVKWFDDGATKRNRKRLVEIKSGLSYFFKYVGSVGNDEAMWTTFKKHAHSIESACRGAQFVACSTRATNEYRHKTSLAYCVNIFYNPVVLQYFKQHGITVDQDRFALSEMVQWIWRSAIRDGKPIKIYVPSSRMRGLLEQWMCGLSSEREVLA